MEVAVPTVTLNSGFQMPVLGMGTATPNLAPDERHLRDIIVDGVKAGYRHLDTAAIYGAERAVGDGIAEAIRQGLVRSREEFFVTSKLWCTSAHGDLVLPALKKSLARLGLEYLDLYLVHWPIRIKRRKNYLPVDKDDLLPFDVKSTWAAMEECQRLGLVRSIGVSNFSSKKLSDVLSFANIPPAVNQVEMNPLWGQRKLRAFCKDNGIQITAYSPLGGNGTAWGTGDVLSSPVLKQIAQEKGKSLPQICLRWLYEQGVTVAVKSFNKDRMKENLQIFDWELSKEDKNKIEKLPQKRGCTGDCLVTPNGPCKAIEELWDGDTF